MEIHAEDHDEPAATSLTRPGIDPNTNMDLLMDMDMDVDNNWASQGFEVLSRRPPRSLQPRFTNREQLSRGSCFF